MRVGGKDIGFIITPDITLKGALKLGAAGTVIAFGLYGCGPSGSGGPSTAAAEGQTTVVPAGTYYSEIGQGLGASEISWSKPNGETIFFLDQGRSEWYSNAPGIPNLVPKDERASFLDGKNACTIVFGTDINQMSKLTCLPIDRRSTR